MKRAIALPGLVLAAHVAAMAAGEVSRGGLHYTLQGSGPVVVLVHAFHMDLREWDAVVPHLTSSRRVLRYDVRSHGSSQVKAPPPPAVADLAALLDELGIERATLAGLSMGATVALDFAVTHPSRVERLVLFSPGPPGVAAGPMPDWMAPIVGAARKRDAGTAAKLWWESPLFDRIRGREEVEERARRIVSENADVWIGQRPPALDPPAGERLRELAMPVLLVAGEQDELGAVGIARTMSDGLQKGRLVIVPGAGHMLSLERPVEVATLVLDPDRAGP